MSFPSVKEEAGRRWTRSLLPGTAVLSLLLTATTAVLVAAPDLSSMRARSILILVLEAMLTAAVVAVWRFPRGLQTPGSRQSANILRNILESSPDMIFVKDPLLRTVLCNSAFASALGRRAEELYGKTDVEIGWSEEMVKG
ncbi:MAG: PAS domain-containing protein, partial [Spirochaetia bacterium]